jgi:uncharacterized damage-inducible protein DinB
MNQNKFFKQFEFEKWSNIMILNALRKLTEESPRAHTLFCHLLNSHSMWLSRVTKTDFKVGLFEERDLEACEKFIAENYEAWMQSLSTKTDKDLEESIEFMGAWENPPKKRKMLIEDALIHIINHSSYHRGQIVVHIKGKVDELPLSTYIMYASEVLA